MKKIVYYMDSMAPAGGIERVSANLLNVLINYFDITLLVKDDGESFYSLDKRINVVSMKNGIILNMNDSRVHRIFNALKSLLLSIKTLKQFSKKEDFDYIFTVHPLLSLQIYLSLGKKVCKSKLINTEHGSIFAYNKVYKLIKKIVYKNCKALISPTTLDEREYLKLGFPAKYIPHLTTFQNNDIDYSKKENIVLNAGRLTSDKQQDKLIEIWSSIMKESSEYDKWKLIIIGKGEEKKNLINKIKNSNVQNIELLDPVDNISEIYKRSKIFAFTSKMEGFGMVLLEAMAFGNACISFDCPSGPRDIIDNNKTGYLIKCFDLEDYESSLKELMENSNLLLQLQRASYDKVLRWDNSLIIKKWLDLLEGVEE